MPARSAAVAIARPDDFGEVRAPWFDDKPVALIGGGGSIGDFELERLRGVAHVIAVKAAMFEIPWADCGVGIDWPRYREWVPRLGKLTMPVYWGMDISLWHKVRGEAWAVQPDNVTFLEKLSGWAVSTDPGGIYIGGTSGFAALGVALLKQARRIALFGYDYQPASQAGFHRNEQEYQNRRHQNMQWWTNWARSYTNIAPSLKKLGIDVVNASPNSRIEAFPKMTPNEALHWLMR